jgi:hypothetical protein
MVILRAISNLVYHDDRMKMAPGITMHREQAVSSLLRVLWFELYANESFFRGIGFFSLTSSFEHTEQDSASRNDSPRIREAHAKDTEAPRRDEEREPYLGTDATDDEIGRYFEKTVGNEEDQERDGIATS